MGIHEINADRTSPARAGGIGKTPAEERAAVRAAGKAERVDRVVISAEGRALAGLHDAAPDRIATERIEQVRDRIRDGVYDSPVILEIVARRILERGDV